LLGDAETLALPFPPGTFDCVICADVLEHLRDPWAFLARVRPLLAPQGLLLASIPNVQFVQVLWELAQGRWTYQPAGILDRTHLRFFTRREFRRALRAAGFQDVAWHPQLPASLAPLVERAAGQSVTLAMEPLRIDVLTPENLRDHLTVQFVVAASPAQAEAIPQEEEPLPRESTISILPASPDRAAASGGRNGSARPWELLQAGKFPEAYEAFEALVRTEPRNTRNLLGLGLAAEGRGAPAAAALAYRTLLHMDPQNADARRGLERVGNGTGAAAAGRAWLPAAP
jgi:tetratricopeptide (TPR) repeat protein